MKQINGFYIKQNKIDRIPSVSARVNNESVLKNNFCRSIRSIKNNHKLLHEKNSIFLKETVHKSNRHEPAPGLVCNM
jgi:hypothetical protein